MTVKSVNFLSIVCNLVFFCQLGFSLSNFILSVSDQVARINSTHLGCGMWATFVILSRYQVKCILVQTYVHDLWTWVEDFELHRISYCFSSCFQIQLAFCVGVWVSNWKWMISGMTESQHTITKNKKRKAFYLSYFLFHLTSMVLKFKWGRLLLYANVVSDQLLHT